MRIARIGAPGAETPAVMAADGTWRDLSGFTTDVDAAFLARMLPVLCPERLPLVEQPTRFGCPIGRPGKVIGIGLNYSSYASAVGVESPSTPVVFLKAPSTLTGPTDPIRPIRGATTTDYEAELGVVVGARLADASEQEALAAVAGYVLVNDVTDRERIAGSPGPWASGKCADSYTPAGPWLVTPDELGDPSAVRLTTRVDGQVRQDASTGEMFFGVAALLAHLSSITTLEPGDLVCTGTPAGTAVTMPDPKPYLRPGQVVEVDGGVLGSQRNEVVAAVALGA